MTDVATVQTQAPPQRDSHGRYVSGTSGNPKGGIKGTRLERLYAAIVADFGGNDALNAMDRALIEQACRLKLRAEREPDSYHCVRLSNAAVRLLSKVGQHKPTKPASQSLAELLGKGR